MRVFVFLSNLNKSIKAEDATFRKEEPVQDVLVAEGVFGQEERQGPDRGRQVHHERCSGNVSRHYLLF